MHSEIGSNFWLNPTQQLQEKPIGTPERFRCCGDDYVWLSTGRSSIKYVIKTIEGRKRDLKKVAILPSFTCDTVFDPFLKSGFEVYYYPVKKDLTVSSDDILKTALDNEASIVLFHRYFGFDTLDRQTDKVCDILRSLEIYTIEDCTQCLYSNIPRANTDYTIGSIRKWAGTPDGGFVVSRRGLLNNRPYKEDHDLVNAKIKASYAKYHYLFDNQGNKSDVLAMYRKAEDILDQQAEIFAISSMSTKVQTNLDINELINKRRENYRVLSLSLCHQVKQLFTLESNSVVPLYFPICVENRDQLQKHLVENAIYAPVVWPKDDKQPEVCEGSEYLYQHLLCIPIDQRYGFDDMYRITEVINNYYLKK